MQKEIISSNSKSAGTVGQYSGQGNAQCMTKHVADVSETNHFKKMCERD